MSIEVGAAMLLGRWRARRELARARMRGLASGWPVEAITRILADDSGWWSHDVDDRAVVEAAVQVLASLDPPAVRAAVAGLSDGDLRLWHRRLGRCSPEERDATYVAVGERVSLAQWRRFGSFTDDIDPDPSGDLRDLARVPDPVPEALWVQARRWAQWEGPLAARGVGDDHAFHRNDVLQGHIGNCYLIAAIQAIADVAPGLLAALCHANDNGTWTVRLPSGRRTVVSPDVVVDVHGEAIFARRPPDGEVELWPMLLEKAYAQLHGGWSDIVWGRTHDAVELLTGAPGHIVDGRDLDVAYLARWRRAGAAMVCKTLRVPSGRTAAQWIATDAPEAFRRPGGELRRLHPGHAFVVDEVDEAAGTVALANPWGVEDGTVVLDDIALRACIDSLHVTQLSGTAPPAN